MAWRPDAGQHFCRYRGQLPDAADRLDYIGANTIEKILADIDLLIGWMKSSYRRCGTFRAGNNAAHLPLKGSA